MENINTEINNKKCYQNCSHCSPIRCSENKDGTKGECAYWKQCGVTAFYCRHPQK